MPITADISATVVIDDAHQLILLASEKCGSSSVLKMFYEATNNEEALQHDWLHNFRAQTRDRTLKRYAVVRDNYKTVKFVRNPYFRAVSCYFSHLGSAWRGKYLGIIGPDASFEEFLAYLEHDKRDCNLKHCNHQLTNDEKVDMVVKIEEIGDELPKLNAKFGTEYEYKAFWHHRKTVPSSGVYRGNVAYSQLPHGDQTAFHDLLVEDTCATIARIYERDFLAYGYSLQLPSSGMNLT